MKIINLAIKYADKYHNNDMSIDRFADNICAILHEFEELKKTKTNENKD